MTAVSQIWREPFPDDEIPFILSAIIRCMAAIKKTKPCELENDITVRLWKRLRRDAELNGRPTHLDPEVWELDEADVSNKIGRLDLRFLFSTGTLKPWPCFAIEAKRLHVTFPSGDWKSLVPEYVTTATNKPVEDEQGMMCFVSGRYSRGLRAGAMLGYVFDNEVNAARTAISNTIEAHATKLRLIAGGRLTDSTVLPNISGISESVHNLADASSDDLFRSRFTIYHLLAAV